MLQITVPKTELYDEGNNSFIYVEETTLRLEHSLISLAKWESKWNKAFLTNREELTPEQSTDYVKCMTLTKAVDDDVYRCLTNDNVRQIKDYISAPMTATYLPEAKSGKINNEPVTAELVYYWMLKLSIPFDCEKWHLNRLLTLIRLCNVKDSPDKGKKMTQHELMSRNAAINAKNRARFNSKG